MSVVVVTRSGHLLDEPHAGVDEERHPPDARGERRVVDAAARATAAVPSL
jgi:hypothetical protein